MARRKLWVPSENIVSANNLASQRELQHLVSPFTDKGQKKALAKSTGLRYATVEGWTDNSGGKFEQYEDKSGNYRWRPQRNNLSDFIKNKQEFYDVKAASFTAREEKQAAKRENRAVNPELMKLSEGWSEKLTNRRKAWRRPDYRVLINGNGKPYTAPNGPAKGKIVMFDAWQSDEELLGIYKAAFEEPYYPGMVIGDTVYYNDPHMEFTDDGHITRIQYNSAYDCMCVHWANRNYVTCYLGVPVDKFDELRACAGVKVTGRGKHNHLLGIRFWDLIRIRGTMTGGRFPFFYEGGAPSGLPRHDVSQSAKGIKNMRDVIKRSIEKHVETDHDVIHDENYMKMPQNSLMDKLDMILTSDAFHDAYNKEDGFAYEYNDMMDDFEEAQEKAGKYISKGDNESAANVIMNFRKNNISEITSLLRRFKDEASLADVTSAQSEIARFNKNRDKLSPEAQREERNLKQNIRKFNKKQDKEGPYFSPHFHQDWVNSSPIGKGDYYDDVREMSPATRKYKREQDKIYNRMSPKMLDELRQASLSGRATKEEDDYFMSLFTKKKDIDEEL